VQIYLSDSEYEQYKNFQGDVIEFVQKTINESHPEQESTKNPVQFFYGLDERSTRRKQC